MKTLFLSLLLAVPALGQGILSVDVQQIEIAVTESTIRNVTIGGVVFDSTTSEGESTSEPAVMLSAVAPEGAAVSAKFRQYLIADGRVKRNTITPLRSPVAGDFRYVIAGVAGEISYDVRIFAVVDGVPTIEEREGEFTIEGIEPDEPDPPPVETSTVYEASLKAASTIGDKATASDLAERITKALTDTERLVNAEIEDVSGAVEQAVGDAFVALGRRDPRNQHHWFERWRVPVRTEIERLDPQTVSEYRVMIRGVVSGLRDSLLGG